MDGMNSFSVSIMEESSPIDEQWLHSFLDMKTEEDGFSTFHQSEDFGNSDRDEARPVGRCSTRGKVVGGADLDMPRIKVGTLEKKGRRRKVTFNGFVNNHGRKAINVSIDASLVQGKQIAVRKSKFKLVPQFDSFAKLDLEKGECLSKPKEVANLGQDLGHPKPINSAQFNLPDQRLVVFKGLDRMNQESDESKEMDQTVVHQAQSPDSLETIPYSNPALSVAPTRLNKIFVDLGHIREADASRGHGR
ncbi:hypothetical protein LWI28_016332 [Acer negundo]|uniref:Uncharacterized protein n=1 Tax=Acer negundo TaxID=4023 RepID=A0AAD5P269_ACENE|nr:hypothetical protein LWI28_016332 [Acer negundo]